jgi:hypothetical protein
LLKRGSGGRWQWQLWLGGADLSSQITDLSSQQSAVSNYQLESELRTTGNNGEAVFVVNGLFYQQAAAGGRCQI